MQKFIAEGCREALLEEKRRFCFLVDKHCNFSYQLGTFHDKVYYVISKTCLCSVLKFSNAKINHLECGRFLVFLKAREILVENITSWQDKCGDATNVPESVMSMIEGLRTPVSITPQASPALPRHSRVRTLPSYTTRTSVCSSVVVNSYLCLYLFIPVQNNSEAMIPPPAPPQTSPLANMFNQDQTSRQDTSRQQRESGD